MKTATNTIPRLGLLLLLANCLSAFDARAQEPEFMHAVGGSYIMGVSESTIIGSGAITYFPRMNIFRFGDATVSLSATPSLAATLFSGFDGTSSIIYELPFSADFNFGAGSSMDYKASAGFSVGAGWAFNSMSVSDFVIVSANTKSQGLFGHLDYNFEAGFGVWKVSAYTIVGDNDVNVYGLRAGCYFGI
ncbi:MAG: hypothetical protein AAGB22_09830 [Bacteroidota bacterium]